MTQTDELAELEAEMQRFAAHLRPLDAEARRAALIASGWLGLLLPEAAGGAGLGVPALVRLAEALGRVLAPPLWIIEIATLPLLPPDARDAVLAGTRIVVPALTELPPAPLLSGMIGAVPEAGQADAFLLVHDNQATLLPGAATGLSIDAHPTLDGGTLGTLRLDGVAASWHKGAASLAAPLHLGLAALLVGHAAELLDRTLEHLRTRRAFGRPLGAFQALQHRAVDLYAAIMLARALVRESAAIAGADPADAVAAVAAARVKSAEVALNAGKWAVQMLGAMGFAEEGGVGPTLRASMVASRLFGTPEAHRRRFAATLRGTEAFGMFRADSAEDATFRADLRAWLAASLPRHLRDLPTRPSAADSVWWHKKLQERGLAAPGWPARFGGMEASVEQRLILAEELAQAGAPEISAQAISHIGPIIMRFGTQAQQQRHLPPMLRGDTLWCQGYSEPNAGSDLASLTTRGVVDGEEIVVTGRKIWTTWAQHADWMFALVRTDPGAPDRRQGISMVLIDMKTPGIEVRPIRTIAGDEEFAEVTLDAVRVPITELVGGLNQGWRVANALLEAERLLSATPQKTIAWLSRLRRIAAASGALAEPGFRDRLAGAEIEVLALAAAYAPALAAFKAGAVPEALASVLKLAATATEQWMADLLLEAAGEEAALAPPVLAGGRRADPGTAFLQGRRVTIYGGTSEIQRNIIARRVLDLGNEPKGGKP